MRQPDQHEHSEQQGRGTDRGVEQNRQIRRDCERCGVGNVDPESIEGRLLAAEKINDRTVDLLLRLPPGTKINPEVAQKVLPRFRPAVLKELRVLRAWSETQQFASLLTGPLMSQLVAQKEVQRFDRVRRYLEAFMCLASSCGIDTSALQAKIDKAKIEDNFIVALVFTPARVVDRSVQVRRATSVKKEFLALLEALESSVGGGAGGEELRRAA